MKKILLLVCAVSLFACQSKKEKPEVESNDNIITEEVIQKEILPDLESGEVFYKNKDPFGETIELSGEQIEADTVIFKVGETEMIVKDDILVVKNGGEHMFMFFQLPEFKFLGYGGKRGGGPDEFNFPELVPTTDPELLCYVLESTNQKLYSVNKNREIRLYDFPFTKAKQQLFSDKQVINIDPDDFVYVETSDTGKSIFRSERIGDSISNREVYNLALNPKRKGWANYIGSFAAHPEQNRMVYAYKYFKILKFMDLEAKTIKTINFEKEEFDESSNYRINGMDENVTHYWKICGQEDYVYLLYSGRKPVEVMRDASKKDYYIYVEQYDWNGNPVRKYKLDQWGYFTVDEKNKVIYLTSTNHDDPFFVYHLP